MAINGRTNTQMRRAGTGLLAIVLAIAGHVAAQDTADNGVNPSRVRIQRQHPEAYKGGRTIAVRLDVSASTWEGLTAIGIYENVPDGWTLAGVETIAGPAPGIAPGSGASGLLEFIWINPPRTPVSLRYELQIPPRHSGIRNFSGQVEYRLDRGKQVSNVALSQLDGEADAIPVIRLRGNPAISLVEGNPFTDPGATATDPEDGDLTNKVQTSGEVDTGQPGRYEIVYEVEDSVGNRAEPARRTVTVRAESAPNGESPAGGGSGDRPKGAPPTPAAPPADATAKPGAPPSADPSTGFPREWLARLRPEFGEDRRDFEVPLNTKERDVLSGDAIGEDEVAGRTRVPALPPIDARDRRPVSGSLATGDDGVENPASRAKGDGRLLFAIGAIVAASVAAMAWWGVLGARGPRRRERGA